MPASRTTTSSTQRQVPAPTLRRIDRQRRATRRDLYATADLMDHGVSWRSIRARHAAGEVVRVGHGRYVESAVWEVLSPEQRHVARILAVDAITGGRRVFSHASAAALHGLGLWRVPQAVQVSGNPRPRPSAVGVQGHLLPEGAEIVRTDDGVCLTSLVRTAVDCARELPVLEGLVVVDQVLSRNVSREQLHEVLAQEPRRRGVRKARHVIEQGSGLAGSPLETQARWVLNTWGLPVPELQILVPTAEGNKYLDMGWRGMRLALEADGDAKYFEYGATDATIFAEHRRERAVQALGWMILRTDTRELEQRPEQLAQRIWEAMVACSARWGVELPARR